MGGVRETNLEAEIKNGHADGINFAEALKVLESKRQLTSEERAQYNALIAAHVSKGQVFEQEARAGLSAPDRDKRKDGTDHAVYTAAVKKARDDFYEKYTKIYEVPKDSSEAEKQRTEKALGTRARLEKIITGDTVTETIVKSVYNEEKGGWQFASMGGTAIGGIIGFMMGNYIAGAGGGGLFGYLAMTGLALAGAAFGSRLAEEIFPYKPKDTPTNTTTPEKKITPANEIKKETDAPTKEKETEKSKPATETTASMKPVNVPDEHSGQLTPTPIRTAAQLNNGTGKTT